MSSMDPAIKVENLSKRYQIGTNQGPYRTLRESITDAATAQWRGFTRLAGGRRNNGVSKYGDGSPSDFWALKDVSFEIEPGEVVGIIGRNGAGKSTLLKILSRITEPTSGRAEFRGRIGSLLEVGTGFHPELTGRENIYLNGSILGMSRRDIARRFDEIVDFAEIEEFLETPVKRYSSGMYVRLAFAVAAHLEPEILLVDEVLAVGDATYQNRCIDRMSQIARSGRSVLFVSHNMDLIPRLCDKAIRLERGRVVQADAAESVVQAYLNEVSGGGLDEDLSGKSRVGDGRAIFTRAWLMGNDGRPSPSHPSGEDLRIRVRVRSKHRISDAGVAVSIKTMAGARIHTGWSREVGFRVSLSPGDQEYECHFRRLRLRPGQRMVIGLWLESGSVADSLEDAMAFEVVDGCEIPWYSTDRYQGAVLCDYNWSHVRSELVLEGCGGPTT
jgi:lipopolysaccharide transport system ATP-binding protein